MAKDRQLSFHGGELDPELWGRSDLELYRAGCRTLRNFLVTPRGALVTRTGTQFIRALSADEHRLWPFVYDTDDAFVMAIAEDGRVRMAAASASEPRFGTFRYNSQPLGSLVGGSLTASSSRRGRIAQIGNIVTITNLASSPTELRRVENIFTSASPWEKTNGDLMWTPPTFPDLPEWDEGEPIGELGNANHYAFNDAGDEISHNFPHLVLEDGDLVTALNGDTDGGYPPLVWEWRVTLRMRSAKTGLVYETLPYEVSQYIALGVEDEWATGPNDLPRRVAVYPHMPITIAVGAQEGTIGLGSLALGIGPLVIGDGDSVVSARLYRGREGRFGFVAETKGYFLVDNGAVPIWEDPPPENVFLNGGAFRSLVEATGLYQNDYPSAVAYFEGRRYFARTPDRPAHVFGSAVEEFYNFQLFFPADDADALSLVLAGETNEAVQHLVGASKLLVLTEVDEWIMTGSGQNDPISPNGLWARSLGTKIGSSWVRPVKVGRVVYFVERDGSDPWALHLLDDGVDPMDVGLGSRHLFAGHTLVGLAYQRRPHSVLWAVRDDGVLLSCTVMPGGRGQPVHAWARHEIAGDGLVEDVAVLPEAVDDGVYLLVNRGGTRCLERLAYSTLPLAPDGDGPDVRYACHLDASVTYSGRNTDDDATIAVSDAGTGGAIGETVDVTIEGAGAAHDGKVIQIDDPTMTGEHYRLELTTAGGDDYTGEVLNRAADDLFDADPTAAWWVCSNDVGGLAHLEGETVVALADGNVIEDLVVEAGNVNLGPITESLGGAAIAVVGLPFTCDFESLASAYEPTRTKTVRDVFLEMVHARGGHVGQSLDGRMYEVKSRQVSDAYMAIKPKRHKEKVPVAGQWDTDAYVAFQQRSPLPVTILGITRDIVLGDRS